MQAGLLEQNSSVQPRLAVCLWLDPMEAEMDARIRDVIRNLKLNCADALTTSQQAQTIGLSRSRFEHLFKEETGKAFKKYLQQARLAKAQRLLRDPTLRIKEIATQCGYSSTSNFSHDFKRSLGLTPSGYRRSTLD